MTLFFGLLQGFNFLFNLFDSFPNLVEKTGFFMCADVICHNQVDKSSFRHALLVGYYFDLFVEIVGNCVSKSCVQFALPPFFGDILHHFARPSTTPFRQNGKILKILAGAGFA
jgi:hypothetical protein